ncbi:MULTISPECIES: hypothetical protein [Burkholderiaceae]|jgi:hypothetical protein|uniref:Protein CopB n=1 Tax=Ralstonia pickettii TaxID=329 RepID=A0AAW4Q9J9_RALPI|nr:MULTISPECIES: hypothetical protein [Burkholderiaceae]UCF21873.1 MAG: hypothetical protein JSV72_12720 [Ralstonia sp.]UNK04300.1 hypothetical protein MMB19_30590 [Ralstonia insidiosa]MBA9847940.1 hypothetical protein [Ralstonia pickettii]MBA9853376.1 hypothetical protein [Ralstonia pickettii]MBA9920993.1 hypothetical protein [Ralstonia pickettii]
MTMKTDEAQAGKPKRTPAKQKPQEKRSLSVRLVEPLHARVIAHCESIGMPASSYIISLIEADLRKQGK